MTEVEWLGLTNTLPMVEWLIEGERISPRRCLLFVVGWYRLHPHMPIHPKILKLMSVFEAVADGEDAPSLDMETERWMLARSRYPAREALCFANSMGLAVRAPLSNVLREIMGNPFRTVACDPAWLTPAVVGVASGIYEERAFDRMPILGDALEDAGCDDTAILGHCRSQTDHVRGCWVVDLLLGKG